MFRAPAEQRGPLWRRIEGGAWGLAATDVKGGTKLYVEFEIGYEYGSAAY